MKVKLSSLVDTIALAVILRRVRASGSNIAETPPRVAFDPDKFYALPPFAGEMEEGPQRGLRLRYRNLAYRSPLATGCTPNDTVRARSYGIFGRGRPAVLILHGWMAATFFFYIPLIRKVISLGLDPVIMQLPYHIDRTPPGSFSGERALCGSLPMTLGAVRQGVLDARVLLSWLKERSSGPVGVIGISLGGLVGALLACVDDRLDFCVLMTPAADLTELFWRSAIGREMLLEEEAGTSRREMVRDYFRIITPRYFDPLLPGDDIVIVQSRTDRIVPSFVTQDLWEAWGRPSRVMTDSGHIMTTLLSRVLEDVVPMISRLRRR